MLWNLCVITARNEQFLLFPQRFLLVLKAFCHFQPILKCRPQTLSVWTSVKISRMAKIKTRLHRTYSMVVDLNRHMIWVLTLYHIPLKVALQTLGRKFYKNTKKSSLYSQCLLIFIHKTQVVESHPTTKEIKRMTTVQVDTDGNPGLFLHKQLANFHTRNREESFKHNIRWRHYGN